MKKDRKPIFFVAKRENIMSFKDLNLKDEILHALFDKKYENPTAIQEKTIPHLLEGKDVLACAQTGTGKTAAFLLPIIQMLSKNISNNREIRALVLTPTRELAVQIRDNFREYSSYIDLRVGLVLGGVNQRSQVESLRKGVDVLIATPGRLLDLINQRYVKLNELEIIVLDEADTMLDMGFINDVKKIMGFMPEKRQTMLFSATMPKEIIELSSKFLINPVIIKNESENVTLTSIEQTLYYVDKSNKSKLLVDLINKYNMQSVLVFTRTKNGANKLCNILIRDNISCEAIHGNKSQGARLAALRNFKSGKSKVLVATDIAARGIDIIELPYVINYDVPEYAEIYVHRIGRTARAGKSGVAISFCSKDELKKLNSVERFIKQKIKVVTEHNYSVLLDKIEIKTNNYHGHNRNRRKYK